MPHTIGSTTYGFDGWEIFGIDHKGLPQRVLLKGVDDNDGQYIVGEVHGAGNTVNEELSWCFEEEQWAKLCFGVSVANRSNSRSIFKIQDTDVVPAQIAIAGEKHVAAYLGCVYRGLESDDKLEARSPKEAVASQMDLQRQVVADHWREVTRTGWNEFTGY